MHGGAGNYLVIFSDQIFDRHLAVRQRSKKSYVTLLILLEAYARQSELMIDEVCRVKFVRCRKIAFVEESLVETVDNCFVTLC
jgi:hypothetical protein